MLMIFFPVMGDSISIPTYKLIGWIIAYMFYAVLILEVVVIVSGKSEKKKKKDEKKAKVTKKTKADKAKVKILEK